MNEFVMNLNYIYPIFTHEMEKWLRKLPVVIQLVNKTARKNPGLPLDHAQAFRPHLSHPSLLAAYGTLP